MPYRTGGVAEVVVKDDIALVEADGASSAEIPLVAQVGHLFIGVQHECQRVQIEVRLAAAQQFAEEAFFLLADFPSQAKGDLGKIVLALVQIDRLAFFQINSHS